MTQRTQKTQTAFGTFFASKLFLVGALVIAVLVAFSYARAYYQDYAIRQEIARLQDEVKQLEHKKLESMELLKYVSSDAYVEEKARMEFNLKKPGEQVAIIPEDTVSRHRDIVPVEDDTETSLKNPIKWWYYFTHKENPNL